ncbi:MAG: ribonuclease HII [Gammaproteobacteria bacterium RIFCSPHIGHO2_12_FULL_41_20]|nr:MAG: ribonuclease HII [Gammaproteobacteria bacterium RIFCSPHIGHO2_12_FULL_41_20]
MFIAGVDEAGRGPLAGPVVAAAVILNPGQPIIGLADSKLLTEKKRQQLFHAIRKHALAWSVQAASAQEIDEYNILQATMLAMQRAVQALRVVPSLVLIDGNRCPDIPYPAKAIIRGDQTEAMISAASIIAKVVRDRWMRMADRKYPGYGLAKHKGYPTKEHVQALQKLGVSPIHRRSFAPVAILT